MINKLKSISEHWGVITFILTGLIYLLGYIKMFYFLNVFGVASIPTDIYSPSAIFVSGLNLLLLGTIMPIIALFIGFVLSKIQIARFGFKFIIILVGLIAFISLTTTFEAPGFYYVPKYLMFNLNKAISHIVFICSALLLFIFAYRMNIPPSSIRVKMGFSIGCLLWIFLLLYSQINLFKYASAGAPITTLSQDSGIIGMIVTENPISAGSILMKQNENQYFSTYGILLYKTDAFFYFSPGIYAAEKVRNNMPATSLCIIPQSRVIGFYHLKHGTK